MNNVKNIISKHNTRTIRKNQPQVINTASCNCRNKETCPLQNKCMSKDLVCKAVQSLLSVDQVGLYRDDGSMVLNGTSGRQADKARKTLQNIFQNLNLRITADLNHQTVNFLDVTFNLQDESY